MRVIDKYHLPSKNWTAEERLRVVAALLPGLQRDIYAGCYSAPGRINITSLLHIISEPPEALECVRHELQRLLAEEGYLG